MKASDFVEHKSNGKLDWTKKGLDHFKNKDGDKHRFILELAEVIEDRNFTFLEAGVEDVVFTLDDVVEVKLTLSGVDVLERIEKELYHVRTFGWDNLDDLWFLIRYVWLRRRSKG
jgi:hypothetical protein